MLVAYLLKKFPRLSETFVLTEILTQEALGTRLRVFGRRAVDDEPRHPEFAGLQATVEQLPRSSQLDPWGQLCAMGTEDPARGTWDRLRTSVEECSESVGERFPRLLAEALHLRERALELGVGHIHVHFATESAIVAMLTQRLGGPSYSITAHAKDIYRSGVQPQLLERLVLEAKFVVTVCDANVEYMRSMLSDEASARVRRLYNGLSLERFVYSQDGREATHLLAVGRLVEKKGFDVLISALAELKQRGRHFTATIAGGGDDADALRAQALEVGLDSAQLSFTGPLNQDDIRAQMKRATLFCLPCVVGADGNRDALPTVLLEALAMGLPCISTDVTGIPEILDRGRVGRIVPQHDALGFADAIEQLLDNPAERLAYARLGRAHAEALFDARQAGQTLRAWFQEALRERASQASCT